MIDRQRWSCLALSESSIWIHLDPSGSSWSNMILLYSIYILFILLYILFIFYYILLSNSCFGFLRWKFQQCDAFTDDVLPLLVSFLAQYCNTLQVKWWLGMIGFHWHPHVFSRLNVGVELEPQPKGHLSVTVFLASFVCVLGFPSQVEW